MCDFDLIMSISSEMIVVVDEAYIMRHATLAFHTEFGLEPETAAGRPLSEVLPQVLTQVLTAQGAGLMQALTTTQPLEFHCLSDHQNYRVRGRVGVNGSGRLFALALARTNAAPEEGGSEGLTDSATIEVRGASELADSSDPLASLAAVDEMAMAAADEMPPPDTPPGTPSGTPSSPRPQRASSGKGASDEDRHALRDGGLASVAELAERKREEKKRREASRPVRRREGKRLGAGWASGHV